MYREDGERKALRRGLDSRWMLEEWQYRLPSEKRRSQL
jgi:hypothetical protein